MAGLQNDKNGNLYMFGQDESYTYDMTVAFKHTDGVNLSCNGSTNFDKSVYASSMIMDSVTGNYCLMGGHIDNSKVTVDVGCVEAPSSKQ